MHEAHTRTVDHSDTPDGRLDAGRGSLDAGPVPRRMAHRHGHTPRPDDLLGPGPLPRPHRRTERPTRRRSPSAPGCHLRPRVLHARFGVPIHAPAPGHPRVHRHRLRIGGFALPQSLPLRWRPQPLPHVPHRAERYPGLMARGRCRSAAPWCFGALDGGRGEHPGRRGGPAHPCPRAPRPRRDEPLRSRRRREPLHPLHRDRGDAGHHHPHRQPRPAHVQRGPGSAPDDQPDRRLSLRVHRFEHLRLRQWVDATRGATRPHPRPPHRRL